MPRTIRITDFTGGRNTKDIVNLAAPNQCTVGSRDVWCPNRALIARKTGNTPQGALQVGAYGWAAQQLKATLLGASSAARMFMVGRNANSPALGRTFLVSDDGDTASYAGYRAGTCSTSGSSTTVTGSGTSWLANAAVGDYFVPNQTGTPNQITAVNSDTEIVVTTAVNLSGGTAYKIYHNLHASNVVGIEVLDSGGSQYVYATDGSRTFRYDGTDVFIVTATIPAGRYLKSFKNYLFLAGHNNTSIRWSALADPTTWPAANTQAVTSLADPCRGLVVYGDSLIFFTLHNMYRVLGDVFDPSNPTYVVQKIDVPANFIFYWPRTAVTHQGILKFLANDGWYGYDGGQRIQKISDIIQPDVDGFYKLYETLEAITNSAVSYVFKNDMWCALPDNAEVSANTNNSIYIHDLRGAWWKMRVSETGLLLVPTDFESVKLTTETTDVLRGALHNAGIFWLWDYAAVADQDTADAVWISEEFVFDEDVEFVEAYISQKKQSNGSMTFGFSVDRASFVTKSVPMTTGVGTVTKSWVPIQRTGKSIRLECLVTPTVSVSAYEIYEVGFTIEESEARRV